MRVEVQIGSKKAAVAFPGISRYNGTGFVPAVNSQDDWVKDATPSCNFCTSYSERFIYLFSRRQRVP
jgi:hypothetical protein